MSFICSRLCSFNFSYKSDSRLINIIIIIFIGIIYFIFIIFNPKGKEKKLKKCVETLLRVLAKVLL